MNSFLAVKPHPLKNLEIMLDSIVGLMWSVTIVDLAIILNVGTFSFLHDGIKIALTLAGLVYLVIVKIPSEIRASRLNGRIKRAEAKKIEMANEIYEEEHKCDLQSDGEGCDNPIDN